MVQLGLRTTMPKPGCYTHHHSNFFSGGFTSDFQLSKFSPLVDAYDFILYNHFLFGILPVLTLLSPDFSLCFLAFSVSTGGQIGW